MVGGGVDGVGADGVGAELLEEGDVAAAGGGVGEGVAEVLGREAAAGGRGVLLVGDALDEELGAVFVEEFGALGGLEGLDSEGRAKGGEGETHLDDDGLEGRGVGGHEEGGEERLCEHDAGRSARSEMLSQSGGGQQCSRFNDPDRRWEQKDRVAAGMSLARDKNLVVPRAYNPTI